MSAYLKQVMADTPIAYWPLNETSGTTANDLSGNARNGTYTGTYSLGGATFLDGKSVLSLSGAGHVYVGDYSAFSATGASGAITLEIWVNPNASTAGSQTLICKEDSNPERWEYVFMTDNSYANAGGVFAPILNPSVASYVLLQAGARGQWHHIVYTYDRAGNLGVRYEDGVNVGQSSTGAGTVSDTTSALAIGSRSVLNTPIDRLQGGVAHAALYPSALSAARVKAHYEAGIRGGVSY